MSEERIESFLGRWSRLKRAEGPGEEEPVSQDAAPVPVGNEAAPDSEARTTATDEVRDEAGVDGADGAPRESARDFSNFDYDTLRYESDYEQFMKADVPDDVRNTALRKLWVSNPILANMDGLDDYCEDFTDAAVCLPKGTMKTAYRFGRGFLSDAEVARWEALGKPVEAAAGETEVAAAAEPEVSAPADADVHESGETQGEAATSDWVESAATSGAGCAAALKAEEHAALESDRADDVSGADTLSPAGKSKA